jgi:hypothetical protein
MSSNPSGSYAGGAGSAVRGGGPCLRQLSRRTHRRASRIPSRSSSARKSARPDRVACISAPPSDSSSVTSPVAIFTSGGPARKTFARSRTMIVWSDIPGTYAPPAVALPNTTLTVGMRAADIRVRSRKTRPPGMKMSAWLGRSAPADSTRFTMGSRFAYAISPARRVLASEIGLTAPPRTVGSLAITRHSTPSTTPMPVTTLPPTGKSVPQPATGDSSRNGASRSSSSSIRSRGSSLPRPWCRVTYFSPPPARA